MIHFRVASNIQSENYEKKVQKERRFLAVTITKDEHQRSRRNSSKQARSSKQHQKCLFVRTDGIKEINKKKEEEEIE